MIKMLRCDSPAEAMALLARQGEAADVTAVVEEILQAVRREGDRAVRDFTARFDGAQPQSLEVSQEELDEAVAQTDREFLDILAQARDNIWAYHQKQLRTGFLMAEQPGVVLGQKVTPLDRVGIYVPGGTAAYPSTVLMDAVPAKLAGVGEIVMVSPPGRDGRIARDILAAARLAGVDRVFQVGGAQAVAALAYGTQSIPRVDKIVGPGNQYVATAKRLVYGQVDIDMIAGPSEILIIADDTGNPSHLAVDLLAQAEHDPLAACFLVTTSEALAQAVARELPRQLATLPRREIAQAAIRDNSAIILTSSLDCAAAISNAIAPEHLEVVTADPFALLSQIKHAGSIFLGGYSPEALGDYFAGPNHTLPTSGTARFSSGLGVDDFLKKSSVICYSREALEQVARQVATFATREGLDAHARSVSIRMEEV